MAKEDVYIYYSGATDITGKALVEALDITGGNVNPTGKKLVIGWGAKTDKETAFPAGVAVLNHPDKIKANRNKLTTLKTLLKSGVNVADFTNAEDVVAALAAKKLSLPLVGRTNHHQGGKGFWLCLTASHVANALKEGAQYFQNYIDIVDEFRLHVFKGQVIYSQKKVKRENMAEAFVEQHAEKIGDVAKKGDKVLDKATMDYVLGRIAKEHPNADMIIRSNTRGWKFASVKTPAKVLVDEAVKALDAVGLDFGAVDCCIDPEGKAWIIEINSGPGLSGTSFDAYIAAFKKVIDEVEKPVAKKAVAGAVAAQPAKAVAPLNPAKVAGAKARMAAKLAVMNDMLDVADEEEAAAVERLWAKIAAKQ